MKYEFKATQMHNEGKTFWVIESKELNGCVAQGDTVEEALKDFEQNEQEWLEAAKEYNIPIPEQKAYQNDFSGKFTVRVAKSTHKKLVELASDEGISLNQFVNDVLCEKIGYKKATKLEKAKQDKTLIEIKELVLRSAYRQDNLKDFNITYLLNYDGMKGEIRCQ